MVCFDKLSENIANTSKDVAKKANEIAKVTGLNGQISSQESLIDGVFKEIGKLVYDNKDNIAGLDLSEVIGKIDAAKAEIERLKAEIRTVKGIKVCEQCGEEIADEVAFCPKCGAKAPVVEVPAEEAPAEEAAPVATCKNCGNPLEAGSAFCTGCGTKVEE